MEILEPGATWMGRYRVERLVLSRGGVSVWRVTDLRNGRAAQLSLFERGSTVLEHGKIDSGVFVVFDAPALPAPRLELVEISDEDAFFEEPQPEEPVLDEPIDIPTSGPKRGWVWGAALVTSALLVAGGVYFANTRTATSETTITAATIAAAQTATTRPMPAPSEVPVAVPSAVPVVAPAVVPEHRQAPAPRVAAPTLRRPIKSVRAPRRHAAPVAPPPPPPDPPPDPQPDPITL